MKGRILRQLGKMQSIFEYRYLKRYETIIVFIVATAIYLNALYGEFLFDDIVAVSTCLSLVWI